MAWKWCWHRLHQMFLMWKKSFARMQFEKSLHDSQIHQWFCPFYHRKFDVFDVDIVFTTEKIMEMMKNTSCLAMFRVHGYSRTLHVKNILLEHWCTLSERFVLFYQLGSYRLASGRNACNANTEKRSTRDEFIQRCRDERKHFTRCNHSSNISWTTSWRVSKSFCIRKLLCTYLRI